MNKTPSPFRRAFLKAALTVAALTSQATIVGLIAGEKPDTAAPPPFAVRGTLPWHNFLCGPSAWNEDDYRKYLDDLKCRRLNLVVFHNYTGGSDRYHTYVEPMIRVSGFDVLPEATFDTSMTARWGYRQLRVADFAFGTSRLFKLPPGVEAFGADCMTTAKSNAERYKNAQSLMRRVMEMAHERGMKFAMGFEVGIHPPEFASVLPGHTPVMQQNGVLLRPETPGARLLLFNAIDDILAAYPGIDQIWLWQQEHGFLSGDHRWTESYVRIAYEHIKKRAPRVQVVLSGWGGGNQLPQMLVHLDKSLPKDIVFTCLNPNGGELPHVPAMAEIARHRTVWAIPWLEHDGSMWHLQMSVNTILENVRRAREDHLDGVIALHWRTEETRATLAAFADAAAAPDPTCTVERFYADYCGQQYGKAAEAKLAPLLAKMDREGWLRGAASPEFYPYSPSWGMLNDGQRERIRGALATIETVKENTAQAEQKTRLQWLADNLRFFLQLEDVGRKMQPAYDLQSRWFAGQVAEDRLQAEVAAARKMLDEAPVRQLFETYASRVRSRGELGVLSSMNQRLWLQYRELGRFLDERNRK
jgi:hypothetical protein